MQSLDSILQPMHRCACGKEVINPLPIRALYVPEVHHSTTYRTATECADGRGVVVIHGKLDCNIIKDMWAALANGKQYRQHAMSTSIVTGDIERLYPEVR